MVAAGPRDQRHDQGQYGERDEQAGDLVKPLIVEQVVSAEDQQTGHADRGDGPSDGQKFAAKKISFFAPLDARLTV